MATLTVYGGSADGWIRYGPGSYATARAGTSTLDTNDTAGTSFRVGEQFISSNYYVSQGFIGPFDTSAIGAGGVVTSVSLSLYQSVNYGQLSLTFRAIGYDWGTAMTTADWRDGTALASATVLGSTTIASGAANGYKTFTENGSNFASYINKTGNTYFAIVDSRDIDNVAPTQTSEACDFDSATGANPPKLVITYTPAVTPFAAFGVPL